MKSIVLKRGLEYTHVINPSSNPAEYKALTFLRGQPVNVEDKVADALYRETVIVTVDGKKEHMRRFSKPAAAIEVQVEEENIMDAEDEEIDAITAVKGFDPNEDKEPRIREDNDGDGVIDEESGEEQDPEGKSVLPAAIKQKLVRPKVQKNA
ncbi:MAG: hypothetical protein ABW007_19280 [Chitinophagaceae bacterium]